MIKAQKKMMDDYDLKPLLPFDSTAYGPVQSRRLGVSLGIDLLGADKKICNFNCPYCELGFTTVKVSQIKKLGGFPSLKVIEDDFHQKILSLSQKKITLDYITFSGNGEPTLFPEFPEAVLKIKQIRDRLLPGVKLTILTNGSMLGDSHIVKALNELDDRMVKLDAGNDDILMKVEAPLTRTNLTKLIQGAKALKDVVIQAMFVQGSIDNTLPDHIDEWIEVVGLIKPKLVHIYSLDRFPALTDLTQVPRQRLKEISNLLEKRTKIQSFIFS